MIWAADQLAWTRRWRRPGRRRRAQAGGWRRTRGVEGDRQRGAGAATAYTQPTVSASTAASSGMAITAARQVGDHQALAVDPVDPGPVTSPNPR